MAEDARIAARDISEAILEITGDALINGDFDAFASVFHVPQYMATLAGPIYMESRDDMRRAFNEMHRFLGSDGVEMHREIAESRYVSDNRIESTHVGKTKDKQGEIFGPYHVFSVIERIDGTWKVTSSEYVIDPNSRQAQALSFADTSARQTKDK